jgi:hypothetical protein
MIKNLKFYILLVSIFGLNNSFSQIKLDSVKLAKISINHNYHCDFQKKKFNSELSLGELNLKLAHLEYTEENGRLNIIGKITDYSNFSIPCNINIVTISDTKCKSEYFIGNADKYGNFKFKIDKDNFKSIYFSYPSYLDLEIKIISIYSYD